MSATFTEKIKTVRRIREERIYVCVGDQISVGDFTATCQEVYEDSALFLFDEYVATKAMNKKNTNEGGYEASDLRKYLQSDEALDIFPEGLKPRLLPFENGDLLRIPTREEIFGEEDAEYFEDIPGKQWELMKQRKNRVAYFKNEWMWGWLQNRRNNSAAFFASVSHAGNCDYNYASNANGVRPAFLIH